MTESLSFPIRLSVEEARARIVDVAANYALAAEIVSLEFARSRILASDVLAPHDVPGFANSAMDGFAVRAEDLPESGEKSFRLLGEVLAGGDKAPDVVTNGCVRITTGAPLPGGADTVVIKENTRAEGGHIVIAAGTMHGGNVRSADEDYTAGDLALVRGTRLTPAQGGVLASFGMTQVSVTRHPHAILLTTGDELTAPGQSLDFGRIYDSNRYSLGGLLQQHGVLVLRHERLRDDPGVLSDALHRAGAEADIIISSGGVSAGEADFLPRLIAEIGKVHFWKVRIRPGMPILFGEIGKALIFALPGNPVSGIASFLALVPPALQAMSGSAGPRTALRAKLRRAIRKPGARTEFQRARLECDASGTLWATPLERQGSAMLRGVAEADALIMLPEAAHEFAEGAVVDLLPLTGWPG